MPSSCIVESLSTFTLTTYLLTCNKHDKANILASSKIINNIVNCVKMDLKRHWCIACISNITGINQSYLISELKRENITFKQLINTIRLKHSISLILSGMSIKQASRESGFSCPNYFSSTFRKYYGYSPSSLTRNNKFVDLDGLELIRQEL
jgi:AraC-like DNA-binding protein